MEYADSELDAEHSDALENSEQDYTDPVVKVRQQLQLLFESSAASEAEPEAARECPEELMLLSFLLHNGSNVLNQSEDYRRKKLPFLYVNRGSIVMNSESNVSADAKNNAGDSDEQNQELDVKSSDNAVISASQETRNRRNSATALHNPGDPSELLTQISTIFGKETVEAKKCELGVDNPRGSHSAVGGALSRESVGESRQLPIKPLERNLSLQTSNLLVWHRYTEIPFDISSSEFTVQTPVLPLVQGGHLVFLVIKCDQMIINYSVKIIKKNSANKFCSFKSKRCNSLTGQIAIINKDEFLVLKKLSHPFVAKMLYFCENISLYYYFFPRYRLANLSSNFSASMRLDVKVCVYVTCCIINAVEYLFRNFIVHRDISSKSVMFNSNYKPVLFHFDYATFYGPLRSSEARMTFLPDLSSRAPEVISPEIFKTCDPEHYVNCDIWGIGVLLGELLLSTLVMTRALKRKLDLHWVFSVREGGPDDIMTARSHAPLPKDLMELLRMCLRKFPYDRPSILNLMQNPVFGKYDIPCVHNVHCKASPLVNDFNRLL